MAVFLLTPHTSRSFIKKLPADQPAPDLARPGADFVELGVAPQASRGGLVDVAHAAQALDRLARHPGRLLRGVEDGAGGVLARGLAAVAGRAPRGDKGPAGGPKRERGRWGKG